MPGVGALKLVADLNEPQAYGGGLSLRFDEVPNGQNLHLRIEARGEPDPNSRVLFHGISAAFSLEPGREEHLDVPVAMIQSPDLAALTIMESVGPVDCPNCYVSANSVRLSFQVARGESVEVANDSGFSKCTRTFSAGEPDSPLLIVANSWLIEDWNLDCGLLDVADGVRTVHVRVMDEFDYVSQSLSLQVVLDREAPSEGTLICDGGKWLVALQTELLFGAVNANDMWVEACEPTADDPQVYVSVPEGLLPCKKDSDHTIATNAWTDLTTTGCVRLKNDSVKSLRVRYRDNAHNMTPWLRWDFETVTTLGLAWKSIPGGTFEMGCSVGDKYCEEIEFPVHDVTLSSFDIMVHPVTESQYEAAMGNNPSRDEDCLDPDSPVDTIDWHSARLFCEKVEARLPTEAEWEYAARGGTITKAYCGNGDTCLNEIAWYAENSTMCKQAVGGKAPNAYGLYDMLGNLWEWTSDWYDGSYYEISPASNPLGPESGGNRVIRGGGYAFSSSYIRASQRFEFPAWEGAAFVGFRCAR